MFGNDVKFGKRSHTEKGVSIDNFCNGFGNVCASMVYLRSQIDIRMFCNLFAILPSYYATIA